MIEIVLAILLLSGAAIFQSVVMSRMPLLLGTADLILLVLVAWTVQDRARFPWVWGCVAGIVATLVSGMPIGVLFSVYIAITGIAIILRRRIWKAPLLTMVAVVSVGTGLVSTISILGVLLMGVFINIIDALNLIVLPGLVLNMLLAIPVYVLIREIAGWINPGDALTADDGEL
jgi:rod shape-determining protein MreD